MFFTVFNNLVTLLICMIAGFIAKKARLIDDRLSKGLSDLLFSITLPATILVSMQKPFSKEILGDSLLVFTVSGLIYLSGALIGFILAKLFRAKPNEKGIWIFALTFPNVGYMGFPVTEAIFGKDIIFFTSMANMAFNLLVFSIGVLFISQGGKNAEKLNLRAILNLPILTTFLGLVFFVCSVRLPSSVLNAFSMLGNMTTPLSMIIIGSILAKIKLGSVFKGAQSYLIAVFRLVLIPLASFYLCKPLFKNQTHLALVIILASMPVAAVTAIFAAKYEADEVLASQIVFITTVFSMFTIPLLSQLIL